jgi:uncharacterized protein (TIGR02452 family)
MMHHTSNPLLTGGPDSPERMNRSRCSFSRNWLLHVATETIEVANRGNYVNSKGQVVDVSKALEAAKKNSVHYHYSHTFDPDTSSTPDYDTKIFVVYGTSLQAAAELKNLQGTVGILNSASARHPGGKFVRGTVSQEDCICRASLLHPCLLQFVDLKNHYVDINSSYPEGTSSSCAIFAPLVPVYRVDSERCPVLDEPQLCSIISMPAPNAFEVAALLEPTYDHQADPSSSPTSVTQFKQLVSKESLIDRLYDRLFRALCIFYENNCHHLILCAFGCGVHGNDPELVAEIFRQIIEGKFQGKFATRVFSIQPSRTYNFDAFVKIFPKAQTTILGDRME